MKEDEKTVKLTQKELTCLFYQLISARDHDWHSGHNKCRRPWDLAKDFCAIAIEDMIPKFEERKQTK